MASSTRTFRRGRVLRWGTGSLLGGVAVLWAVSYWHVPAVTTGNWASGPRLDFSFFKGSVLVQAWSLVSAPAWPQVGLDDGFGRLMDEDIHGWNFGHIRSWGVGSLWWAPLWAVWSPVAGLTWWAWRRGWGAGRCARCGYDVRGLGSSACPECGGMLSSGEAPGASVT